MMHQGSSSLLASSSAAAGTVAVGNAITAIAAGADPLTAVAMALLGVIPNPWLVLGGYLFWRYYFRDYLASQRRISIAREKLIESLAEQRVEMRDFMTCQKKHAEQAVESNIAYMHTHQETIPRLERKLDTIIEKVS